MKHLSNCIFSLKYRVSKLSPDVNRKSHMTLSITFIKTNCSITKF